MGFAMDWSSSRGRMVGPKQVAVILCPIGYDVIQLKRMEAVRSSLSLEQELCCEKALRQGGVSHLPQISRRKCGVILRQN